jgi:dTDP-4-dehydrorhamnose 3,5-epimerase
MDGVVLTPLKIIPNTKGDILHAMKATDESFIGFGEAYFSCLNKGAVKGWKKHTEMTLNLIVVFGKIKIVVFNQKKYYEIILSKDNYHRLTIRPGLWVSFQGLSNNNILLNLANIVHNPNESENVDLSSFDYDWD